MSSAAEEAERLRRVQDWDSLPKVAYKLAREGDVHATERLETESMLEKARLHALKHSPVNYVGDTADNVTVAPTLDTDPAARLRKRITPGKAESLEGTLLQASTLFWCGDFQAAIDEMARVKLNEISILTDKVQKVALDALVSLSLSLYKLGRVQEAVAPLRAALLFEVTHRDAFGDDARTQWIEDATYHLPFLLVKLDNKAEAVDAARLFLRRKRVADATKRVAMIRLFASLRGEQLASGASAETARNEDGLLLVDMLRWLRGVQEAVPVPENEPRMNVIARTSVAAIATLEMCGDMSSLAAGYELAIALTLHNTDLLFKYASTLARVGKASEALAVAQECVKDARAAALAATLLLGPLDRPADALEVAEAGLRLPGAVTPRLLHLIGVAKARLARHADVGEAEALLKAASKALAKAAEDPAAAGSDIFYNVAIVQAERRRLNSADTAAVKALEQNPSHAPTYHLYALILSARKDFGAALRVCEVAAKQSTPDAERLLTQVQLELKTVGLTQAQNTLQRAVRRFARSSNADDTRRGDLLMQRLMMANAPGTEAPKSRLTRSLTWRGRDTLTASQSSIHASITDDSAEATRTAAAVWSFAASFYASLGNGDDAEACIQEAARARLAEPSVWTLHGEVMENRGKLTEAQERYEQATQLDPLHTPALHGLGRVLMRRAAAAPVGSVERQEYYTLAEHYLSSAVAKDKHDHVGHLHLGQLYLESGQAERAAQLFEAALEAERTAPVRPFALLPLTVTL